MIVVYDPSGHDGPLHIVGIGTVEPGEEFDFPDEVWATLSEGVRLHFRVPTADPPKAKLRASAKDES